MTQEERYWYEKRLYMQADAKEREIRDVYNQRLRGLDFRSFRNEADKQWQRRMIEGECHRAIDFARLQILEPILDEQQKTRLQNYRKQEIEREQREKEEAERKRKEQEIAIKQKHDEELKENQRIIEPLVSSLLQRKKLSWEQRCQIAKYTNNQSAIKKLKYDNSLKVLDALLTNPNIDFATIQHIQNRKKDKIDSKNAYQEIRGESKEDSGCLKLLITILFIAVSINLLINFIAPKL